jgi:hypothetical protein
MCCFRLLLFDDWGVAFINLNSLPDYMCKHVLITPINITHENSRPRKAITVVWKIFLFGIQEFIHSSSVSGKSEHPSSKNRSVLDEPTNTEMVIFSKISETVLIKLY